jgi:DNA gyrase/topoisomerase IV subunit A
MLQEWIDFRQQTVERRSQHRLAKVLDRIHILEGRQLVLLNIDEVIAIIRQSDEPKAALIARFKLSERQAEDILEIRLRQLARLEAIKIEQELSSCATSRKAGRNSGQPRGTAPPDGQGDRGRRQTVCRPAPHADPGRERRPWLK